MKRNTGKDKSKKESNVQYPLFAFRISQDKKNELSKLVGEVQELYRRSGEVTDRVIKKNDIIIEALEKGLSLMKKSKG